MRPQSYAAIARKILEPSGEILRFADHERIVEQRASDWSAVIVVFRVGAFRLGSALSRHSRNGFGHSAL